MEGRFDEVCEIVLKHREHRSALVQRAVIVLMPALASYYKDQFIKSYLKTCMAHLISNLKKNTDRAVAFQSIGEMALAVGEHIRPYLDSILQPIKESLSVKGRKGPQERTVYTCISMLSRAVGPELEPHLQDLLEPLFGSGLNKPLTDCLIDLAGNIPTLLPAIQDRLLDNISYTLARQTFKNPGVPKLNVMRGTMPRGGGGAVAVAIDKADGTIPDAATIALALHTLGAFDFSGHVLTQFVKDCVVKYLEDENAGVRKEAALTCAQLLVRSNNAAALPRTTSLGANYRQATPRPMSTHGTSSIAVTPVEKISQAPKSIHSVVVIGEVLEKLLIVGIADPDSDIRWSVLSSLDDRFDNYLAQAENLRALFVALNDEVFAIRELAIGIIGRLTVLNPAYVMPSLRKTLIQLLTELEYSGVSRNKEESARLLSNLISNAPRLIKPYVEPILRTLLSKLRDLSPGVSTNILAALGELAQVGAQDMVHHVNDLLPLIIETLLDQSSVAKREVALRTLGKLAASTGYVIEPYLRYPKLLRILLDLLKTEQVAPVRREVIKVLGILGALDPYRHRPDSRLPTIASTPSSSSTLNKTKVARDAGDMLDAVAIGAGGPGGAVGGNHGGGNLGGGGLVAGGGLGGTGAGAGGAATAQTQLPMLLLLLLLLLMIAAMCLTMSSVVSAFPAMCWTCRRRRKSTARQCRSRRLMRILKDLSLAVHHTMVVQAIMFICKSLGLRCVPFLPQIMPPMLQVMRTREPGFREFLFQQLGALVAIVKQHIRNYLPEIFVLIREYWDFSPAIQITILSLVESISLALGGEFKAFLPELIPHILRVFMRDDAEYRSTLKVLHALEVFGSNLDDYLHLVIPPVVTLFESFETRVDVRRTAIQTLTLLCRKLSFSDYASRIIHPLTRVLDGSPELRQDAMLALTALVHQLGADYIIFIPLVSSVLARHRIQHQKYDLLVSRILENVPLPEDFADVLIIESSATRPGMLSASGLPGMAGVAPNAGAGAAPGGAAGAANAGANAANAAGTGAAGAGGAGAGGAPGAGGAGSVANAGPVLDDPDAGTIKKLHVNQKNLKKMWEVTQKSTKEDWTEWIRRFSVELLKESPSPALRSCSALSQIYTPLARELFNAAFVSCWTELYEQYQEELVQALETALLSPHIPPEIQQTLLNLAEFMEHDDKTLPIDFKTLGEYASKCHAYAKALHYKEIEFYSAPNPQTIEALITINNLLQKPEAAAGILVYAQQNPDIEITVHESWYEKLQQWDQALASYEQKQKEDPLNFQLTLGRMRCLNALGDWDELHRLCQDKWQTADEGSRRALSSMAANAAWGLGRWESMDDYLVVMPRESPDAAFFAAVLALHRNNFPSAHHFITVTRDLLDTELTALAGESYNRAYGVVVRVQMLAELEEVMQYKLYADQPDRQQIIRHTWMKRLRGCQRNVEVWQRILKVRSLVIPPHEDKETWIKFASLCRKSSKMMLGHKTLCNLLATSATIPLSASSLQHLAAASPEQLLHHVDSRKMFLSAHPRVSLAVLKYLWHTANKKEALEKLRECVGVWQVEHHQHRAQLQQQLQQQLFQVQALQHAQAQMHPQQGGSQAPNSASSMSDGMTPTSSAPGSVASGHQFQQHLQQQQQQVQHNLPLALQQQHLVQLHQQHQQQQQQHNITANRMSNMSFMSNLNELGNSGSQLPMAIPSSPSSRGPKSPGSDLTSGIVTMTVPDQAKLLARCYIKLGEWEMALMDSLNERAITKILDSYLLATTYDDTWYKAWHSWALMNFEAVSHFEKSNANQKQVRAHIAPALTGFFRSIALMQGNSLQDTLRLLTLWFKYGSHQEVHDAMVEGIKTVSIDTWLQVIPQLIARIHTPSPLVGRLISQLLISIGKEHPQALIYPVTVASKSQSPARRDAAYAIMDNIRNHAGTLVDQALLVSQELIRVAILWHEMWHEHLEEASRLYFGERNIEGMLAKLEPLHQTLERGPETLREISFHQAYGQDLMMARDWTRKFQRSGVIKDLNSAWDLYYHVFRKISKQLPQLTSLELQYVSPKLLEANDLDIAVPGTYRPGEPINRIRAFGPQLTVITSKQRPRKLAIQGSDGRDCTYLLKGHEDLRQDERVMQLFGLVNTLLGHDPETFKLRLGIQRMEVIPLGPNSGLIGWLSHCDTLHALIRDYRESRKILLNIEHRLMLQMAPDYDSLTLIQKVEVFKYALDNTTGQDLYKVLWLKSPNSEAWLERRTNYTRSLAVMSMVGYILGLGDRHPSNLMLDRFSGNVIHIDFGDCFEIAMHREKFPERIPFRLTRMLVNAMEVSGIEGNYRVTCENVMRVLRENKESLMAVLEAFVYDPLINWRLIEGNVKNKKNKTTPSKAQTGNLDNGSEIMEDAIPFSVKRARSESELLESTDGLMSSQPEMVNNRAVTVINRVQAKLTGRDFSATETLETATQVQKLISQAQSHENLCQCYVGWCPFW
ncbi:TOR pathway phosphatidylinositol 3-kinase TorA [Capsaspora owczarzaki ATCC 30864]|nr:TOR pathway phosphatidylinositol 3-kinase TorA [Capsaspora owczarzaki ATCC 30864]|eukprot:XP_004346781.2 TOR pathway phosphatidylinositol 3-kinase TorA [Capsaspora owczarzaki ATCC 30864]